METARALARMGGRVILACRSAERGEAARRAIVEATGNASVELRLVDLASQRSIRDFAAGVLQDHPRLHVLVNNAGVWLEKRRVSPDGIERTWATNVLAYFLLGQLLLAALARGAPARIVNVASQLAAELDIEDVEFTRRRYRGVSAYSQSKQADRMLTWALARRIAGSGVTANAMHPGGVRTAIFRKAGGIRSLAAAAYARLNFKSAEQGADTVVWLAASQEAAGRHGRFWIDRGEVRCRFADAEPEERLWSLCARMTGQAP
jgi:NAD(P)-dependent dehydrogenase (short-subunit alcohol dehydrogenase family)